jgi:hypothetical protein
MAKKFICNGMLGKLCKLLRICGVDTLYSNKGIKVLIEAKREKRIILTKNTKLKGRNNVFFIDEDNPSIQLRSIIEKYNLRDELKFFSRCLVCNELLMPIDKELIRDRIPYYTYKNFNEFAECPNCQRVYWKGSHYKGMMSEIRNVLDETPDIE